MQVPKDAIIPNEKITRYLLVLQARNDKSKFLARAGFTLKNPEELINAIRLLVEKEEAIEDRRNEYGVFYQVTGELVGVNGVNLSVTTVWLFRQIDQKFQFVTLKPHKETK